MPDDEFDIIARARELFRHRQCASVFPVPPIADSPADMATAYAVQDALDTIFRGERGYRAIGYKIAATNPASRVHLQIDAPFFGRLYDGMASGSPCVLPFASDFLRVHEPEVAIEIGRDLMVSEAPFDAAEIEAATRAVLPAIEIIGTYFDPWTKAGAANLASDNAAFGHWIMGVPVTSWSGLDLLDGPVTISIDGEVRATGKGRNVDDGAFGATAWLANALAVRGIGLKAGDYVTTGSVTPPIPVQPGQRVRADFAGLGSVEVHITADRRAS